MFCKCGKLMTADENGYICICGLRKTFDGQDFSDDENERIAEIKKKADQLLKEDARMHIVEMMDKEARSADTFFDHIRTIVANKEKEND